MFILNLKFIAGLEFILALITIINVFLAGANTLGEREMILNGVLGVIGGLMLWKRDTKGLILTRIWALLQIPIYIKQNGNGIIFAWTFFQTLTVNMTGSDAGYYLPRSVLLTHPNITQTTWGINLIGLAIFLILFGVNLNNKNSKTKH